MAEFIDRDALLHVIGEMPIDWEYGRAVSDIYEIIKNAPAINPDDLRPRGRWVPNGQCEHVPYRIRKTDHWTTYKCSECGYRNGRRFRDKFCTNCGARMEE
ncbi:MAG: hypothetical protein IJ042_05935 [Butyricicoccus sp.]|nr:hypothetical protein [Butyricicoccus sp.]